MVKVLKWRYNRGEDDLLDYIASVDFNSRDDIANDFGVSVKTVGRRLRKLKDEGKLVIHRYQDNKFVYMIGNDVVENWGKNEALEIYGYRNGVYNESQEDDSTDDIHYPTNSTAIKRTKELDIIVDKLVERLR